MNFKGPEWTPLLFAHPSTLNNPFDMATYGVAPSHTPEVQSTHPLGSPLFKVDRWANSNGFHSGPFCANKCSRNLSVFTTGLPVFIMVKLVPQTSLMSPDWFSIPNSFLV